MLAAKVRAAWGAARRRQAAMRGSGGRRQVFAAAVDGGPLRQVSDIAEENAWHFLSYRVSPDAERVVYRARVNGVWSLHVWAAPLSGGSQVRLDDQPGSTVRRWTGEYDISPDSARVVFRSVPNDTGSAELVVSDIGVRCGNRFATIVGTDGDDIIRGTDAGEVIAGLGGDDFIFGNGGRDHICGGPGDDRITGGRGRDTLRGQRGDDLLVGNRGQDRLFGGAGDDTLQGRRHQDILRGGDGRDLLNGGPGVDDCLGGPGDDTRRRC